MDLTQHTAFELIEKIKKKEIKPSDVMLETYSAIEKKDEHVNAFLTLDKDKAVKRALELDKGVDESRGSLLVMQTWTSLPWGHQQRRHITS